jgi:hypothetical protein
LIFIGVLVGNKITTRNMVVGNAMVACYVRGAGVAAMSLVVQRIVETDEISWNTLMHYCTYVKVPAAAGRC